MIRIAHSQEKISEWLKNNSRNGNTYEPRISFYRLTDQKNTNTQKIDPEERLKEIKEEIERLEKEKIKVLYESINIYKNSILPNFIKNKRICNCLNSIKLLVKDPNEKSMIDRELGIYTKNLKDNITSKQMVNNLTLNNSVQEISARPVYKISKDAYPSHIRMLENSRTQTRTKQ